jgi:hypothetical protein
LGSPEPSKLVTCGAPDPRVRLRRALDQPGYERKPLAIGLRPGSILDATVIPALLVRALMRPRQRQLLALRVRHREPAPQIAAQSA